MITRRMGSFCYIVIKINTRRFFEFLITTRFPGQLYFTGICNACKMSNGCPTLCTLKKIKFEVTFGSKSYTKTSVHWIVDNCMTSWLDHFEQFVQTNPFQVGPSWSKIQLPDYYGFDEIILFSCKGKLYTEEAINRTVIRINRVDDPFDNTSGNFWH